MTKRTVYARYADKSSLFRAAVHRAIRRYSIPEEQICATDVGDLEQTLINIAMLAAVNRQPELRTHVRAAHQVGGVTKEEIMEVLLHTTVYAGVPAGVDAFRTAKAYFDEAESGKKVER